MLDRSVQSLPRSFRSNHKPQLACILTVRMATAVLSFASMIGAPRYRFSHNVPTETIGHRSIPPDPLNPFREFRKEEMSK